MWFRDRLFQLLLTVLLLVPVVAHAQSTGRVVASCGTIPQNYNVGTTSMMTMLPTGEGCISGSISASLSGFTATSTGTPISVTTGGVTGTLPAGAVVVATNVGGTNGAYCALGASATTASQYLSPGGGWFAFTVGASTQLTCITSTSTTTVNMTGGAGLPTGTGGGGGGAIIVADGADVTQGAIADAAATAGSTGTIGAKLRLMTTQLGTLNTTLGSPFQAGGSIGNTTFSSTQSGTWTVQPGNTANTTAWLVTGTGGTFPVTGTVAFSNSTIAVTNAGTFATQSAVTAASGSYASGSIASGAMVDLGAIADAAATQGSSGSVSAKLRTVTSQLNTVTTNQAAPTTAQATNPSATLTLTSATTAYTAGQLIASSATAGSVVNPSFAIANSAGGAIIPRLRLSVNDTTSTAWGAQTIQVDLWVVTPTWTNGDRATWLPATGAAATSHVAAYTCIMGTVWGDGVSSECVPVNGNFAAIKLASGTSVFWTLQAVTGSGVTGASKVFTIVPEVLN